jgi:gas vesicle protein
MSNTNSFRSFIIGGIMGAAAGLLLAPRSGEETRKLLQTESLKLRDSTLQAIQESKDAALESIAQAYEQVEQLREETNQRLKKLGEITSTTIDDQKEILQKGVTEAKKTLTSN